MSQPRMQVVITMAGLGSRFRREGYQVPKYRILARERALFDWSLESLRSFTEAGAHVVFVMLAEDRAIDFVNDRASKLGLASHAILELREPTDGQATTAMLAEPLLTSLDGPFVVYNIDTYVDPKFLPVSSIRGDAWIPCFDADGAAWSFVAVDASGRASEVREKVRISSHATIGLYYFKSFNCYRDLYVQRYGRGGNLEQGERYIAPMYNNLIEQGGDVFVHDVPAKAVVPLGTPEQVLLFDPKASPAGVV